MSQRPRLTTSTQRRYSKTDEILSIDILIMRPCTYYVSFYTACILSDVSKKYEQYHRFYRPCDLASLWTEIYRLADKEAKLLIKADVLKNAGERLRLELERLRQKRLAEIRS
jgi:hypothetical protein